MANDDFFTANETWQAVQANGVDITNGTFSIFSQSDFTGYFWKSDTLTTATSGPAFTTNKQDVPMYDLNATEKLYCMAKSGSVTFGVITVS